MKKIMDAHGLMIFLEREPGYEKIEKIFLQAVASGDNLLMTVVNFGEVYYIVLRECGQQKADEVEKVIQALPIDMVGIDITITKAAARIKANKRLSYADCFATALAIKERGELITGDKEFREVEDEIRILWI
jgi:predicted nucleic acid-binding protein